MRFQDMTDANGRKPEKLATKKQANTLVDLRKLWYP